MVIALGESATMREIEGVRSTIIEAFQIQRELELDVSQIANADLSFLQVVESARKLASAQGKGLRLTAPATPFIAALLDRAGFLADGNSDIREFWLNGDGSGDIHPDS